MAYSAHTSILPPSNQARMHPSAINYLRPRYAMPHCVDSLRGRTRRILFVALSQIVIEENETELYKLLHDELGFDVLTTPFRKCYEFGGALHCATCDIRRRDTIQDFFAQEYN